MIDAFSKELPELAQEREAILTAEQGAIKAVVEEVRSKLNPPAKGGKKISLLAPVGASGVRFLGHARGSRSNSLSFVTSAEAAGPPSPSILGDLQYGVIGRESRPVLGGGHHRYQHVHEQRE